MKDPVHKRDKKKKITKKNPCQGCPAICCHDLAMMMPRPRTKDDIETVSWYLHFDTVQVFIRHHRWYVLIKGKCIYLGKDYKCKIYKGRSNRCRRHDPTECEKFGKYWDVLLDTPEDLRKFLHHKKKPKKAKPFRKITSL